MAISADKNYISKAVNDGLSIAQIARCLRRSTQDLGQLAGDITPSGNSFVRVNRTNKWAKYKPVRKANMWVYSGDWWKADDGKCGLNFTTYSGLYNLVQAAIASQPSLLWGYNPPRGMAMTTGPVADQHPTEPYRLLDFDGYRHNAESPIPSLMPDAEVTVGSGGDMNYASAYTVPAISQDIAAGNLTFTDIFPEGTVDDALGEYYFGVILHNIDEPTKWCVATSSIKIKNAGKGVWLGITVYGMSSVLTGAQAYSQLRVIPFFSSQEITEPFNHGSSDDIEGAFVSADNNTGVMWYAHRQGKVDLGITHNCRWRGNSSPADPYVRGDVDVSVLTGPLQNVTLHNVQVNVVEANNHSAVVNGQSFGTVTLYSGVDDRAEGALSVAIYASAGDIDTSKDYVIELACDELTSGTVYSATTIPLS